MQSLFVQYFSINYLCLFSVRRNEYKVEEVCRITIDNNYIEYISNKYQNKNFVTFLYFLIVSDPTKTQNRLPKIPAKQYIGFQWFQVRMYTQILESLSKRRF